MPQCQGIKRDGGRCIVIVAPGVTHCYHHASERAEQRRRNASIAVCNDIEPPVRAHFDAAASDARIVAVYCSSLAIGKWVNYCAYRSSGRKPVGTAQGLAFRARLTADHAPHAVAPLHSLDRRGTTGPLKQPGYRRYPAETRGASGLDPARRT